MQPSATKYPVQLEAIQNDSKRSKAIRSDRKMNNRIECPALLFRLGALSNADGSKNRRDRPIPHSSRVLAESSTSKTDSSILLD